MAAITPRRAVKSKARLRLALVGPAGSGKTYSALVLATVLAEGKPIAVIDTERNSADLYGDIFEFDVVDLEEFRPQLYVEQIENLDRLGYGVIVIDSLSHAWEGKGGALDQKDAAEKRQRTPNSYTAWRDITPIHNALVDAILGTRAHVIATMRAKTEYVQEKDQNGKTVVRKVGMKPIQRDGLEYEFTVVGDMDWDKNFIVTKTRIPALDGEVINRPGPQLGKTILAWLNSGAAPQERPAASHDVPDAWPAASTSARQTTSAQQPPASGQRNGGQVRQAPPISQHEAIKQLNDVSGEEFADRAAVLGFGTIDDGKVTLDYKRIAQVLGLGQYLERRAAYDALNKWRKTAGGSYRVALHVLGQTNTSQQPAASVQESSADPAAEADLPFGACQRCGKTDAWREGVCTACGYTAEDDEPACTTCGAVGGLTEDGCTFCGEKSAASAIPATDVKPVQLEGGQPALAGVTAS